MTSPHQEDPAMASTPRAPIKSNLMPPWWQKTNDEDHPEPLGSVLMHAAEKYQSLERTLDYWNHCVNAFHERTNVDSSTIETISAPMAYLRMLRSHGIYLPEPNTQLMLLPGMFHCFTGECRRIFNSQEDYDQHITHDHTAVPICSFCSEEFTTTKACNIHVKAFHIPKTANIKTVDTIASEWARIAPPATHVALPGHSTAPVSVSAESEDYKTGSADSVVAKTDSGYVTIGTSVESSTEEPITLAQLVRKPTGATKPVDFDNPMTSPLPSVFAGSWADEPVFSHISAPGPSIHIPQLLPTRDTPGPITMQEAAKKMARIAALERGASTLRAQSRLRNTMHADEVKQELESLEEGEHVNYSQSISEDAHSDDSEALDIVNDICDVLELAIGADTEIMIGQQPTPDGSADFTMACQDAEEGGSSDQRSSRANTGSSSKSAGKKRSYDDYQRSEREFPDDADDDNMPARISDCLERLMRSEKPQMPCPTNRATCLELFDSTTVDPHGCSGTNPTPSEMLRSLLNKHGKFLCTNCCELTSFEPNPQRAKEIVAEHKRMKCQERCVGKSCEAAQGKTLLEMPHTPTDTCNPSWRGDHIDNEHLWRYVCAKIHADNDILEPIFELGPAWQHIPSTLKAKKSACSGKQNVAACRLKKLVGRLLQRLQDSERRQTHEIEIATRDSTDKISRLERDVKELKRVVRDLSTCINLVKKPDNVLEERVRDFCPQVLFFPDLSSSALFPHNGDQFVEGQAIRHDKEPLPDFAQDRTPQSDLAFEGTLPDDGNGPLHHIPMTEANLDDSASPWPTIGMYQHFHGGNSDKPQGM